MKILALDIGGSFIKYAQFEDGVLAEPGAIPTQADQGPEALLRTVRHLADQFPEKQAVGISFASQINPVEGCISSATRPSPALPGCRSKNCWNGIWVSR